MLLIKLTGGLVMQEIILTCDLGTTSCKSTLFTTEGKIKSQFSKEYNTYYPQNGWAEQDAEEWWDTVVQTVKLCTSSAGADCRVIAISLSSQRETFVPLDRYGKPLCRAIPWLDGRNTEQVKKIEDHFGRDYIHQTTGMVPYPNFTAGKLLWMKENKPDILKNTYKILQPRDYIYYRLTGIYATDYSLAARTMMFNIRNKQWSEEIMDFVGVKESMMPATYPSHEFPGAVLDEVSKLLDITEGIPVILGGGDRCCEALGSGISGMSAMESTATAGNLSYVADVLPDNINDKMFCTPHIIEGKWLMEQGITTTGSVLRWFRDNIYNSRYDKGTNLSYDDINEDIKKSPIGSNKLVLLPFFMGARSTRFNPLAKGALFGLSLSHNRGDIGRSIMEGVAFEVRACLDVLYSSGFDVSDIVLMGGGSKADVWNSIKADVYNRAIRIPEITEASSFGAFILAGYSLKLFNNPQESAVKLNKTVKEYYPDMDNNKLYMKYYDIYNKLYNDVEPLYRELNNI
jgi:Sugar (pentulose and hexulose) kinases